MPAADSAAASRDLHFLSSGDFDRTHQSGLDPANAVNWSCRGVERLLPDETQSPGRESRPCFQDHVPKGVFMTGNSSMKGHMANENECRR